MNIRLNLVVGFIVSWAFSSFGAGLRFYHLDAAAMSRGNAFAATADNPSAIYYNPAGITQLEGHNFRAGFVLASYNYDYLGNNGVEKDTIDRVRMIPQLYYTYAPTNRSLSFGLGLYTPYGQGTKWPDDTPFRSITTKAELLYVTLNPVLAYKITDRLSLAAGPHINYADIELRNGLVLPYDQFRFTGDGAALGFNAGLLWRVHEQHALGLNYRSETTFNLRGHTTVNSFIPAIPSGQQDANVDMPFPQNVTIGYSYRPTPAWNFEFDLYWTDWSRLKTVTLKQTSGNVPMVFNWRSSFDYTLGATRYFRNGYSLSGGYILGTSSVPETQFNPAVPDLLAHCFSLGLGHQGQHWRWDAGYLLAYSPPYEVKNSAPSAFGQTADGRYDTLGHFLGLSIQRKF